MKSFLLIAFIGQSILGLSQSKSACPASPSCISISHIAGSSDLLYTFCSDGRFKVFDKDTDIAMFGKWAQKGDSIFITYELLAGNRCVNVIEVDGQPASLLCDEYVMDVIVIDETEIIDWGSMCIWLQQGTDTYIADSLVNCSEIDFYPHLPGKYYEASEKVLDSSTIAKHTKTELRIMRNEIYARYGYIFKSKEMQEYFNKQPWYEASRENVDKYLSDIEKANIELIKKWEEAVR